MSKKRHEKDTGRSVGRKSVPLNIRVSEPEKAAFARAAEIAGTPLSAWMRERLRYAALRELDNVGEVAPFFVAADGGSNAID